MTKQHYLFLLLAAGSQQSHASDFSALIPASFLFAFAPFVIIGPISMVISAFTVADPEKDSIGLRIVIGAIVGYIISYFVMLPILFLN